MNFRAELFDKIIQKGNQGTSINREHIHFSWTLDMINSVN